METKKVESGIIKNSNGTYDVRVATHVNGKYIPKRKRSVSTLGEARRLKKLFQDELGEQRNRVRNGIPTWKKACEDYFIDAEQRLAPSTLYTQRKSIEAHTDCWANTFINDFYKEMIHSHILKVLADKGTDTQSNLAKYIRCVLKIQVDRGVIRHNPANGISYKKKGQEKILECMTQTEMAFVLREAHNKNHDWRDIFRTAYGTGARSGELLAMTWEDVSFENKYISINKSWCSKSKSVGPTKNRKVRVVPIGKNFMNFLKELKLKRGNEEFVLPQLSQWKHGEASKILRSFQKDIGVKETNFHSIRASFITHLLLLGRPVHEVQKMVGHSDLKTTQRYVRLAASDLKGATDPIDLDLVFKIIFKSF